MRRGAAWSLAAAVVGAAGTIVVTPEIIRALGLADFGLYVLVVTVTSYAMYVDLGLPWAATRYFADDLANGRTAALGARFHTASCTLLAVSIAAGAVAIAAGPWLARQAGAQTPPAFRLVVAIAAIAVVLSLQASLVQALLRALQQFDALGRVAFATSALMPVATLVAIRLQPSLAAAVSANLLVANVALFLSLRAARRALPFAPAEPRWDWKRLDEMIAFTGWSFAGRLAMLVVLNLDRVVVAVLGTVAGLAHYAVAAQLAGRVNLLGGVSTSMVYSRASVLHASHRLEEIREQHDTLRRILLCAALASTLPLVTLGPTFLEVWIGAEMRAYASPILVALAAGHAIMSVTSIDAAVIDGAGRADLTAKTMVAWALIATVSGLLLHPWLGVTAIAVAVCLWLTGAGVTTVVLRQRFLRRGNGSAWRTAAGVGCAAAASLIVKGAVESRLHDVPMAIAAMAASGAVVAMLGLVIVLRPRDRDALFRFSGTRDAALVPEAAVSQT